MQDMQTTQHRLKITHGQETIFELPQAWKPLRHLGSGAYGTVYSFDIGGSRAAVKKVDSVLSDCVKALRTLREIRLLAHLQHPNILGIKQVFVKGPEFSDVYMCLELMDCDLHTMIKRSKTLEDQHFRSIMHQITCGLLCLHTASIIHRDLKPGNVLVAADGDVKLADFGLARAIEARIDYDGLTEYVVTRYYRAPEVVLTATEYTYAVDIWSAGCILGEMFLRKPLFQGRDCLDQVKSIISALGGLSFNDDLQWLERGTPAFKFIESCHPSDSRHKSKTDLWHQLEDLNANVEAQNLLKAVLQFNPKRRLTAEGMLEHAYLKGCGGRDRKAEVSARKALPVDWRFDSDFCYDDEGEPKEVDAQQFREAILESQSIVRRRSTSQNVTLLQKPQNPISSAAPISAIKKMQL
jgi:serine/threonine protein kinase